LTSPKRAPDPEPRPQASRSELLRLLVEEATDYAIFVLDPQGRVATWNKGAQRLKGYTPEEILGKHFSVFYPPEAVETGWPDRELQAAAEAGRFEDEGWRVRKDGTLFWANVIITALRDASGELQGFSKITRDLTERREGEERPAGQRGALPLAARGNR
jgi:PAS domain S-box-containing protein